MAVAAIIAFIVVFSKGETAFSFEPSGLYPLVYLGIFSTTVAFLLQTIAQKYISETKAAIILSTEAFWGMAFSVAILSEVLTLRMGIGAVLILSAIILSETKFSFLRIRTRKIE